MCRIGVRYADLLHSPPPRSDYQVRRRLGSKKRASSAMLNGSTSNEGSCTRRTLARAFGIWHCTPAEAF
jgi:hypothetical protein